ncbi:MAG: hypothetical protein Tsb0020_33070 [Haliangiales bacterium]
MTRGERISRYRLLVPLIIVIVGIGVSVAALIVTQRAIAARARVLVRPVDPAAVRATDKASEAAPTPTPASAGPDR